MKVLALRLIAVGAVAVLLGSCGSPRSTAAPGPTLGGPRPTTVVDRLERSPSAPEVAATDTSLRPTPNAPPGAVGAACVGPNPYDGLTAAMLAPEYDLRDPVTAEAVRFLTEEVDTLRQQGACVALVLVKPPVVFLQSGTDSPAAEALVRRHFRLADVLRIEPAY